MLLRENNIGVDLSGEVSYPFATYLNLCPFASVQNSLVQRTNRIYSDLTPYGLVSEADSDEKYSTEFPFDIQTYCVAILIEYRSDTEHQLAKARRKFIRRMIRSAAVSMAGHLSFLVPRYKQVSIETAAKDEVVHFEGITLAEAHGHLNLLKKVIQTVWFGWRLCTNFFYSFSTWHALNLLISCGPFGACCGRALLV
jgi:hypothetical protein